MIILKLISRLLDYPSIQLFSAANELIDVANNRNISQKTQQVLIEFIKKLTQQDLYDAQERYDLLFDRGRSLSLLLFEHVHGESRDRGQAMVNLMQVYQSKGFEICSSQLPDYIPLYLEFLSEQGNDFAQTWLADIAHLMALLAERLIDRHCDYSVLFEVLIELSGLEISRLGFSNLKFSDLKFSESMMAEQGFNRASIAEAVKKEKRDDTAAAIDQEWEDKEIKFNDPIQSASQCASPENLSSINSLNPNKIQQIPIKWHQQNTTQITKL